MPKKTTTTPSHNKTRTILTDDEITKFEATFPHMAFPRSDTRCMVLPAGSVTWRDIFTQVFPHIKMQENKKFSGEFRDVNQALLTRSRHRIFSLSLPTGTLLLDGGGSLIWPDLDTLCSEYSRLNHCAVAWIQERDASYCPDPKFSAWESGKLLRKHAPGLREKLASYLQKNFITQEQFNGLIERHQTIGNPLPCEEAPDALSILAYYGWTREIFTQSGWKSVTTSFD
jgi:hypothetical protein